MKDDGDSQVGFSGITERRNHNFVEKIKGINERLNRSCNSKGSLFIDNSNVDENSLNTNLLHFRRYGNTLYSWNLINTLKEDFWLTDRYTNDTDITKRLSTANTDISQILKGLRLSNPKNVILSYLNVNSITNKFENLQEIIKQNADVLAVAETKIDASFQSTQIFLEGYRSLYRLDISHKSGGLLVYVKATIPFRQLSLLKFQFRIQALPFELNLRKEKWLVISIYRQLLDLLSQFPEFLTGIIDFPLMHTILLL